MEEDSLGEKKKLYGELKTSLSQRTEQRSTNRRNSWRKSMLTATDLSVSHKGEGYPVKSQFRYQEVPEGIKLPKGVRKWR